MSTSRTRHTFCLEEENAGATTIWKRMTLPLLICLVLVIVGLVLALILVSVDKEDAPLMLDVRAIRQLKGWGEWGKVGHCDRECGGGNQIEKRTCHLGFGICIGDKRQTVPCNTHICQG